MSEKVHLDVDGESRCKRGVTRTTHRESVTCGLCLAARDHCNVCGVGKRYVTPGGWKFTKCRECYNKYYVEEYSRVKAGESPETVEEALDELVKVILDNPEECEETGSGMKYSSGTKHKTKEDLSPKCCGLVMVRAHHTLKGRVWKCLACGAKRIP